jgi:hypothetical protein
MNIFGDSNDNKFLHIDYNDLEQIQYNNITIKDILEYISLIDSYIYNKFGNEQKNILILNRLLDELSLRINNILQVWCNKFFENPLVISNEYKILQTKISTDFITIIISIYTSCFIDRFIINGKLLLLITKNIKNYLIPNIEKIMFENMNECKKNHQIENLIAISNDLEVIKNEFDKLINKNNLTEFEINQIQNELNEINYVINTNIEIILDEINYVIVTDFDEAKIDNKLHIDIVIVTLDDYFNDLINWMKRKNLLTLIEKIYVKIINSELIEKFSGSSRDRFEEYFRVKLNEL